MCRRQLRWLACLGQAAVQTKLCGGAAGGSRIDQLVLVDRVVDLISPMCTQLTYEGLIDETLHIKNGTVTTDTAGGGCSGSASHTGLPLLMLPFWAATRQAALSAMCCCPVPVQHVADSAACLVAAQKGESP